MSNRIDEFANALDGWLAEYRQKRQVSVLADQRPFLLTKEGNNQALGSQAQQRGILKLATEQPLPAVIPSARPLPSDGDAPGPEMEREESL